MDERFDPAKALAATGRYLKQAKDEFGREDLAVVSYHMGIGNLQSVLGAYGDDGASYAQLYFDASPDSHARAYRMLYAARRRLEDLLLARARLARGHAPLPRRPLEARPAGRAAGGSELRRAGAPPGRHRRTTPTLGTLRPEANALARVHPPRRDHGERRAPRRSGCCAQHGFAFDVRRDYASDAQAQAFQYMLDRLQALNLIAWARMGNAIHVVASSEARDLLN